MALGYAILGLHLERHARNPIPSLALLFFVGVFWWRSTRKVFHARINLCVNWCVSWFRSEVALANNARAIKSNLCVFTFKLRYKHTCTLNDSESLFLYPSVTCPGGRNLTASEGILMSPGYSETHYPNSTVCIWVITAPQHWKVKLMINSVDLEYCAMCSCDYVELRDGAKASGPLISRYCEAKASTVYSEGRHMWVKFESDRENEGRGFLANYTFIKLRKSKLSNEYL